MMKTYSKVSAEEEMSKLEARIRHYSSGDRSLVNLHGLEISGSITINKQLPNSSVTYRANAAFIDCIFENSLSVSDYILAGNISFRNCTFKGPVSITSLQNSIIEDTCLFESDLDIRISDTKEIEISGFTFEKILTLTGNSDYPVFVKNLNVGKQKIGQKLFINSNTIKNITISNIVVESITCNKTKFEKELIFEKSDIKELIIQQCIIQDLLLIDNCLLDDLNVNTKYQPSGELRITNNSNVANLRIDISRIFKLSISNSSVQNLSITGSNKKDDILEIQKSSVYLLKFQEVYNNGLIRFHLIQIDAEN